MREWALAGAVGASPEVDTRRRNAAAEALAKATIQADAARAALAETGGGRSRCGDGIGCWNDVCR